MAAIKTVIKICALIISFCGCGIIEEDGVYFCTEAGFIIIDDGQVGVHNGNINSYKLISTEEIFLDSVYQFNHGDSLVQYGDQVYNYIEPWEEKNQWDSIVIVWGGYSSEKTPIERLVLKPNSLCPQFIEGAMLALKE